jgi:hypothetical protein
MSEEDSVAFGRAAECQITIGRDYDERVPSVWGRLS